MDNSPGLMFWILALVAIVPAALSVTLKKAIHALFALTIMILGVAVLLFSVGAIMPGLLHLVLFGAVVAATFLTILKGKTAGPESTSLKAGKGGTVYALIALIIFMASLSLISNTGVWQYVEGGNDVSSAETFDALFGMYLVPIVLVTATLIILAAVTAVLLKRRAA